MASSQKISELAKAAAKLGIPSFLLGVKNGPMVTIHFDAMPLKDAMEILIAGFHQIISIDLERNPTYSPERKQIYADLAKGFDTLIRSTNDRFIKEQEATNKKK